MVFSLWDAVQGIENGELFNSRGPSRRVVPECYVPSQYDRRKRVFRSKVGVRGTTTVGRSGRDVLLKYLLVIIL